MTVLELGKKENKAVLDKVIPELKKRMAGGSRPTKREVNTLIQNAKYVQKPPAPLPENKYDIILADPPWRYEFSETQSREIENQYPTMELEEIKSLKVPASDNAILLLWATAPKLEEGMAVLNGWGFKYRSCAVWDKEKMGMGYWFRIQHELLLVGIKGNFHPPEPENRIPSVIRSPRGEHSKKPACIHEMIEKMFPHGTKIELFARTNREGWTSWGNEV
jgi:N6-adenosine-specific RNA methylase IME4